VYSLTYPNGDGFPLLIIFLCNAYRHLLTFAKWHLRVREVNLSIVLWANKEIALRRFASVVVRRFPEYQALRSGRRAGGFYV
jgi:hypothetical protein